jgi:ferredoxin
MKKRVRKYSCHYCQKSVTICPVCDRGHTYCSKDCSQLARKAFRRRADQKYQNHQKGKLKHAKRQKRYRMRHKKIVTDHSSKPPSTHALLLPVIDKTTPLDDRCHFCGIPMDTRTFDGTH